MYSLVLSQFLALYTIDPLRLNLNDKILNIRSRGPMFLAKEFFTLMRGLECLSVVIQI